MAQMEATRETARAVLEERIGSPFPDLTLINTQGEVVRLSSFRGRRVAVLAAVGQFVTTQAWLDELAGRDWKAPTGYDELIVLVSHPGDRSWRKQIKRCPMVYLVGWPLEGFLSHWRIYPTMYGVAVDGTFEGFWLYGQQIDVGDVRSNKCVNPSDRPVTGLACARPAAVRPTGYAQR
jgi:hypothetical protein